MCLPTFPVIQTALAELQRTCAVKIGHLPSRITALGQVDMKQITAHGLLYLEHPYVVPGGQFNEMYGWDSYFIILGLLRDNRITLAKGMVENFFYEIEHYGGILNANRTYYLTRSQPPFLTSMILAVFEAEQAAGQQDRQWLDRAYGFAVRDYGQWIHEPNLAGDTGLSRYFDRGDGPVPEILGDPNHYYRGIAEYFLLNGTADNHLVAVDPAHRPPEVLGSIFPVSICDPVGDGASANGTSDKTGGQQANGQAGQCAPVKYIALSADFYKGDRSMRESGFDVSSRFGAFGAETHHYAPVCLNSLLYKSEKDLEHMSMILDRPKDAQMWRRNAAERRERMVKYLWNESRGMFFDYNFVQGAQSNYDYLTTFYPMWAGLASKKEARAIAQNLQLFEQPGGLAMSRLESQAQWDYPYGWAPIHLLAAEGLRRYGFNADADRISTKFLRTVLRNFRTDNTIREKYDVVTSSSVTRIRVGYAPNEIGFGWTNGVFLELLHQLPDQAIASLGAPVPDGRK